MKKILLPLLFLFLFVGTATITFGQLYRFPKYERQTNPRLKITKVQITDQHTIVEFLYVSQQNFTHACVNPNMHLVDVKTGKQYAQIKIENIPNCPDMYYFQKMGQRLRFRVYFKKLENFVRYINVIEDMENGFNFYKVHLKPLA